MKETLEILSKYVKANIEFLKIELKLDFADLIARMIFLALLGTAFLLMLLMLSFAVAHYLNHLLGGDYIGFILVSGIFLMFGSVMLILEKYINLMKKIKDYILRNLN